MFDKIMIRNPPSQSGYACTSSSSQIAVKCSAEAYALRTASLYIGLKRKSFRQAVVVRARPRLAFQPWSVPPLRDEGGSWHQLKQRTTIRSRANSAAASVSVDP